MVNGERKPLGQDTNHVHAGTRRLSLENPRQNARVGWINWGDGYGGEYPGYCGMRSRMDGKPPTK